MTDEKKSEITKEYLNNTFKQTEANQLAIMIGSKCFYEGLEKGLEEGRKEICEKLLEAVRTHDGMEQITKFYVSEIIKNIGLAK